MRVKNKLVLAAVMLLDQAAKYLVMKQKINFSVIQNSGLPLGVQLPGVFNLVVVVVVSAVFIWLALAYLNSLASEFGFALIVGGAVSNLIDRAARGSVLDFIDIGIATLNLADIAIWTGIGWLIFNFQTRLKC